MMKHPLFFIRHILGAIEEIPLRWGFIIVIAEVIVALRIFLEITMSTVFHDVISLPVTVIFFNTWFLSLFFFLVICLSIASRIPLIKVAKVLICGLPIILIPPIGLMLGVSDKFTFLVGTWKEILYDAVTFTMFHEHFGFFFAIEIIIFLLGAFFFLISHTSWSRSILGVFAAYGTLIFFGTQPVFFEKIFANNFFGFSHDQQFALLNTILLLASFIFIFLYKQAGLMRSMFFRFRSGRILFFLALCVAMIMGALESDHFYLFNFIIGLLLFCLFVAHTLLVNDMADIAIDRISNPLRPYSSGILKKNDMYFLNAATLIGLGVLLFIIGSIPLYIITMMNIAASTLYSPFRFRKNPFSFLLPALGWSTAVFYGFFAQNPFPTSIPFSVLVLYMSLFLLFCFFIPIKDVKDIVGDTKEGVKNYMTIFGYREGRAVTAASASLSFPAFSFMIGNSLLFMLSIIFSACTLFFVMRYERFGERPLFFLLLFFLLTAIFVV